MSENSWELTDQYVYVVTITSTVKYATHTRACNNDTASAIIHGHVDRAQTHPQFYPRGGVITVYKLPRTHIYTWTGGVCEMNPTRPCGLLVIPL